MHILQPELLCVNPEGRTSGPGGLHLMTIGGVIYAQSDIQHQVHPLLFYSACQAASRYCAISPR